MIAMSVSGMMLCALMLGPAVGAGDVFTTLDYEAALAKAEADDLLFLVDATAEWCGPCKRMERETWSNAEVIDALAGAALAIQVDVDEQPKLARKLEIRAMPTIIAIRDGKEIDRYVGYLGPDDFLEWFAAVREGVSLTEQKRAALLEQDAALQESTDENARYEQAQALVAVGEYDRAVRHYLWLWENIGSGSPLVGVRSSFMLSDMADLGRQFPPAKKAFGDLQRALSERVHTEPLTLSSAEWTDWIRLGANLDESRSVLQWVDSIGAAEGGLTSDVVSPDARDRLLNELLDLMIAQGRSAEAAGLGADLRKRTSDAVAIYKMRPTPAMLDMLPADMKEQFVKEAHAQLRRQLSGYHAVALLAGDSDDAEHISRRLLDFLDDADSRVDLVRTAIRAGAPASPHLIAWLDEAAQLGEPVDALREELLAAGG